MFGKSVRVMRLFGFEVKVDFSWLVLGLLITWSLGKGLFPGRYQGLSVTTYWLMGAAGAAGLFFSIVFHELWHSLVARRFGLPMTGITLFIFGGVAEMTDEPANPRVEFFMAVAGPLSSIVLGAALLGFDLLAGAMLSRPIRGVVNYLGLLNLALAGFNLVPAFPLDGGRVLRSILWAAKGNIRWATKVASSIGAGFGLLLIALGTLNFLRGNVIGGLWLFLIGMFLRNASQGSYRQIIVRRALEGEPVRRFMVTEPVTVGPGLTIEELVEKFVYRHHFKMYPVVEDGRLAGCVSLGRVKQIPREEWSRHTVREIAADCSAGNTIGPEEDALKALALMSKTSSSRLMVTRGDRLLGIVTLRDLMSFLSLKIDLEGDGEKAE